MVNKTKKRLDLFLYTLGGATAIGLFIIADKLSTPIKGRNFQELRAELNGNLSASVMNILKGAFGEQPELTVDKTYSYIGNLFVPMTLFILASLLLLSIIWHLGKSILVDEDTLLDKSLKILFTGAIGFISYEAVQNGWFLLVLNIKLTVVFLSIGIILFALFIPKSTRTKYSR